jgi:hypothetical protein
VELGVEVLDLGRVGGRLESVEDVAQPALQVRVLARGGRGGGVRFEHPADLEQFEHALERDQLDRQREPADDLGRVQCRDVGAGAVPRLDDAERRQRSGRLAQRTAGHPEVVAQLGLRRKLRPRPELTGRDHLAQADQRLVRGGHPPPPRSPV